jgi:hypothetical protein
MWMDSKRVVQVALTCFLLAVAFSVGGCFPDDSAVKAEVYAVLDRLESGMLSGDVEKILSCYTDPYYYHDNAGRLVATYTHESERGQLTEFFRRACFIHYALRYRSFWYAPAFSPEADVDCYLEYTRGSGDSYIFHRKYLLVKQHGQWKIIKIVDQTPWEPGSN